MNIHKIKIFEWLRIINPLLIFGLILAALYFFFDVPLVLAVSVACLTAAINFSVMSMVLRRMRDKQ